MSVNVPMGASLLMQRVVRTCTTNIAQQRCRPLHSKVEFSKWTLNTRTFGTSPVWANNNGSNKNTSDPSLPNRMQTSRPGSQFGRRRPLSPLERISQLLPQDALSSEVAQLREHKQDEDEKPTEMCPQEDCNKLDDFVTDAQRAKGGDESTGTQIEDRLGIKQEPPTKYNVAEPISLEFPENETCSGHLGFSASTLPGERSMTFGEALIAEYRKKGRVEFRKMFQLQNGVRLQSSWGTIAHNELMGFPSGMYKRTTLGIPILIRRPSLEEFVLNMRRGPAIAYPKDANEMLMMMDVSEGDCVLESGSGSGAMSLFLSRAVGSKGSVVSVEIREDHHKRAVLNYKRWRASWMQRRGEEWPDNVHFYNTDLQTASSLLAGRGFHSIALDIISPQIVLPTVTPHLHSGAVCAVYLANITQVIDLLEGVRCSALPLLCERIIEVQVRDWLLAPAIQKDGQFCTRKAPPPLAGQEKKGERSDEENEEMGDTKNPPFGSIPYIARPHPEQTSHTAFLVKLRKCEK
ncbi:tRNA (adenine(58)-N(1))-methyltransferase, mitochondrial [Osmerus mordax]|uniref:tRNA (adenine(58)-N(1))-methyltransferase, mitochondrial n=1 Tax=Osmerus mordax TaxID=8014 RepID=UPI00350EA1B3